LRGGLAIEWSFEWSFLFDVHASNPRSRQHDEAARHETMSVLLGLSIRQHDSAVMQLVGIYRWNEQTIIEFVVPSMDPAPRFDSSITGVTIANQ
jgi:hypothetical protein